MKGARILCPECSQESVLKVVKKFDGFMVIGESRVCALCGHEFPDGEIPFLERERSDFFDDVGKGNVCRNCVSFAVNPWVQKCVIKDEEVDALDTCDKFEKKKERE